MVVPDIDSYLNERVEGQIAYHDRKALESRRRFRGLAILSIAASSFTPLLIALDIVISPPSLGEPLHVVFRLLPVAVAVLAAIATVSLSAFKHKETWVVHRYACEALRREAQLFRCGAGQYAVANDPRALFVEKAETLMDSERDEWKRLYASDSIAPRGD